VRSSTFNSSNDVPAGAWSLVWGVAILLVLAGLGAIEIWGRGRGYQPSIKDGPAAWSKVRSDARAPAGPESPLVLAGTSRFSVGLDPEVLSEEIGRPVVDLALAGSLSFFVLKDLAEDTAFHGLVLCEIGAFGAGMDDPKAGWSLIPVSYIKYFHTRTAVGNMEETLREMAQSRLLFLLPSLGPRFALMHLTFGPAPRVEYVRLPVRSSRFGPVDYSHAIDPDVAARRWVTLTDRLGSITDPEVVLLAGKYRAFAEAIRARGGDVVFFRMLASGIVLASEERLSPRRQWDLFATQVPEIAFNFEDVPSLRDFKAADGSHLDVSDTAAFTRALGRELIARGVFKPGRVSLP
jgi:hypothetical protein